MDITYISSGVCLQDTFPLSEFEEALSHTTSYHAIIAANHKIALRPDLRQGLRGAYRRISK